MLLPLRGMANVVIRWCGSPWCGLRLNGITFIYLNLVSLRAVPHKMCRDMPHPFMWVSNDPACVPVSTTPLVLQTNRDRWSLWWIPVLSSSPLCFWQRRSISVIEDLQCLPNCRNTLHDGSACIFCTFWDYAGLLMFASVWFLMCSDGMQLVWYTNTLTQKGTYKAKQHNWASCCRLTSVLILRLKWMLRRWLLWRVPRKTRFHFYFKWFGGIISGHS